MEKEAMISIENLNKQFKNQLVLNNINVKFSNEHIYGIIGRNGSGKTVLLKCICGFLKPTTGVISVNHKIVGKDIDFPENLGFIIETPGFLLNYSGYKNLKYLASIREKIDSNEIKESMSLVGLDSADKKHVGKYSMGMRQRLGIAQAIMEKPDILVLDEPMNALDKNGVEEMRRLFLKMKSEGKLILLTSHNREDIEILCDEVYEMEEGILNKLKENTVNE
ncbi:ATP-binding cassette domain-containing protein [Blautia schinkii]|uniref:ATP-binding cassette domain-containing protein n=1 Tax=Blautia schinkii TaxID=180164 RepID=UPI0015706E9C|nr:ATP-binding cassette domain-containing protein [Blautia schinkii]NSG83601.1 ATP-binding cassette domain-containing protein [Blautia schinkii]NSK24209.1 ATP-binding cassette domain-containing protein [Blautia schinkii]NSK27246.1 ATP-binding cassette domain-containing protein [Blautia schinkii]NSK33602.1 ATP-binding cassette domain-containing protein [Blautia schinkii]NSK49500.1 ATP-binding cassette domain-containing protein [Blautia schinkii]